MLSFMYIRYVFGVAWNGPSLPCHIILLERFIICDPDPEKDHVNQCYILEFLYRVILTSLDKPTVFVVSFKEYISPNSLIPFIDIQW